MAQPALQVFGGCFEGIPKDFYVDKVIGGAQVISVLTFFYIVDFHSALILSGKVRTE